MGYAKDYLIIYIEILTLTLVYTGIILFNVRREMGNDWEVNIFKGFLSTLIVALVMDGFTQAQYLGFLHMSPFTVAFLYSSYMFLFSCILPLLWFIYAEMRLDSGIMHHRVIVIIIAIPALVMSFMSYATIRTGWFFTIDSEGIYTRGRYWHLQIISSYLYFMFTTVHAFIKARREPSRIQRRQYYTLSMFLIAPVIGGILQLLIGNHPFVAPATGIAMLFIFINVQGSMINNDSLTGLYNRKSAERYIDELKLKASSRNPFYLYMMDIDYFKKINDTYGHIEGDKALRITASVLQKVSDEYSGFLCRLGGDEFMAAIESEQIKSPEEFRDAVREALNKERQILNLPYELALSIGYSCCDSPAIKLSSLIADADKNMYIDKQNK